MSSELLTPRCSVRTMRRDEIALALEFAAREGWNPGLHDAHCFAAADPDGFLIAEVDGQPAGCISAVSYEGRFGFIGLYIVVPEFRGQGIGMRLWTEGMQRLSGHLVGLDGVPAQQDNYRKSGFQLAWQNVRYAGTARRQRRTLRPPGRPTTRRSSRCARSTSRPCAPTTAACSRRAASASCVPGSTCRMPRGSPASTPAGSPAGA